MKNSDLIMREWEFCEVGLIRYKIKGRRASMVADVDVEANTGQLICTIDENEQLSYKNGDQVSLLGIQRNTGHYLRSLCRVVNVNADTRLLTLQPQDYLCFDKLVQGHNSPYKTKSIPGAPAKAV